MNPATSYMNINRLKACDWNLLRTLGCNDRVLVVFKVSANSAEEFVRSTAEPLIILVNTKHTYVQQSCRYICEAESSLQERSLTIFHLALGRSDRLED